MDVQDYPVTPDLIMSLAMALAALVMHGEGPDMARDFFRG